MNDLNRSRKMAARRRGGCFLALLLLAGLLTLVTTLRANNPPTYWFQIDSSAVPGGFQPNNVVLDANNNVYISDVLNNRIVKFTAGGTYLTEWGSSGSGNGQFDYPQGIAVDSSNNVYVADSFNNRIQEFDSEGNYVTQWGSLGNGNGQFNDPIGIAVDSSNNFYVVDDRNNRIEKLAHDGTYLTQWRNEGNVLLAGGIAVDSANNVYVNDLGNFIIQKFDSNLNPLTQWGSFGNGNGQFTLPDGIAVDSGNNVYVTDWDANNIQKFDGEGNYLTQWGSSGSGNGQFDEPAGVVVDGTGNFIYVTDFGNSRIQIFVNNTNIVPPIIRSQPADNALPAGVNVSFSVGIVGTAPLAYQWTSNNVAVSGATNATFTLTNVSPSDAATYSVLVTNSYGSALSSNAMLTVYTVLPPAGYVPPTYLFQIDASAVPGGSFIPQYLALDSSNNVYVTDSDNTRIFKFSALGTYLAQWGSFGTGNGQFYGPGGVAVDSSNNVYVPDFGLPSRIQKFDSNGDYLTQWAIESDLGNFNGPEGVAVDSGNNIYVTAPQNCLVEKFDSNGNYLTQWGNAELYIPAGVAVDSSNNVYVASEYDNQIVKFDSDGNYLTQWGSQGSGNGQFEYPKGIAVDSGNDVYVTDIENDRVEKFDSNGDYLTQWGDYGGGNGQFTYPVGVAVDRTGNYIYVADQEGGRIEVFANNTNIIPPFITQPPTNQTVPAGVSVTFSVIVVGAAPLAYQWSSNNVAMSGATNVTFTVTNVSLADSGSAYSVLVTNSYGSAFSSNATLTVLPVAEYVPPTYLFQFDASAVPGGIVISGYLALDSSNNVYVSDGSNSRIVKFTSNGTFLTQWGSYGSGNGQFDFPYLPGIAVDSDNNVYVADSGNARVEKFESNGNYLTQWGSSGNGNGQFSVPLGVAVDSSNNVYVTDEQIARIEKFDSSGNYLTQWGSYGSYVNELLTPAGIAVDSSNNVYVAESIYDADLVEKFDSNGNHLAQWGSYGSGNGQFDNDNGGAIAADRSNNVYVTDIYNNRIEKFDSNGTYLTQWGSYGSGNGQFDGPDGVAVDSTGNFIYVTDPGNGRIEVFANNVNNLPPYITSQPASQTVPGSINVTFSVSVAGGAPFAYQWTSNNVGVPGATNATFTLTNVNLSQSGSAYAVLVTNNYGSLLSSNALLTIVPAVAITLPASSITTTGAVLNGSVTVGPDETVTWFEWGTETNYGNIAGETIVPGDNGSNNISSTLSGLPGNIYYYRMDVANDFGIVYGNDVSFTVGLAPSATTLAAVNRTNGWTLNASVNPNGWDTTVYFLWETDYHNYNLTNSTPVMDAGAGATALNVSNLITGLAPTTRYYYEVWASNYLGIAAGSLVSFLSPPFTSAPLAEWRSVTASADGSKLVAAAGGIGNNQIITSTDSGANWTQVTNASFESWGSVASSADGTKMVAAPYSSIRGTIYVSTNSGADWTPATNAPGSEWITVASSADGMKLAAGALKLMGVYTSTNAGVNWTCQTNGLGSYSGIAHIASSADGSELVATTPGNGYGPIFTSTNSGINWIQATNAPIAYWTSVACSADGNTLMACFNSLVYLSTDAGVTWIIASLPAKNWSSVAESADGTKMTALANSGSATLGVGSGGIYTSTDSGTTWVSNNAPSWTWTCAAMSADGNEIIAAVGSPSGSGSIYVLQTIPAPRLNLSASNNDNFISWIIPSLDFTLQRSPDLSSWTDLTNQPVLNLTNLQNQVTLPPPDGNSFFRLMH